MKKTLAEKSVRVSISIYCDLLMLLIPTWVWANVMASIA